MNHKILLLGEDRRQDFLFQMLKEKGCSVLDLRRPSPAFPLSQAAQCVFGASWILTPLPFTRDQKTLNLPIPISTDLFLSWLRPGQTLFGAGIPLSFRESCAKKQVTCIDSACLPQTAEENAALTAEGAICCAIKESSGALHKSLCLTAGYGRCGQALAEKLKGLHAEVTVLDRDPEKLKLAHDRGFSCLTPDELKDPEILSPFAYLFNTIPCPVFSKNILSGADPEITIIDIASAPGGVDFEYCRESGRTARLCPGLPGRFSPKAAAEILFDGLLSQPGFPVPESSLNS